MKKLKDIFINLRVKNKLNYLLLLIIFLIGSVFFLLPYKVQATIPTFVACGAAVGNTAAITLALPAGITVNDILLMFLETSGQTISVADANGGTWVEVANSPQSPGGSTSLTIFWSRYNGTQGNPTTSDSGNHQVGAICAYRGVESSGDPWDATSGGVDAVSDTSGTIPGATTISLDRLVVIVGAGDNDIDLPITTVINVDLANISNARVNAETIAGDDGGFTVFDGQKESAGAYGNTSLTYTSVTTKGMMTIALKPPATIIDTTAPATVTDLVSGNPGQTSMQITWTAPGDDGSTGTATTYDLRYSTSLITAGNFSSATQVSGEPTPSVAGSSESMTVTGLSSATTYYFALKTSDEVPNTSDISNIPSGTTSAVPEPEPSPTTGSGGGGGGVVPRRVSFSGQAYPEARIEVLRKSATDEIYVQLPAETSEVKSDGTFSISYTGLIGADYFFALRAYDKDSRSTGFITFNVSLFGDLFEAKDILMPPTLDFKKFSVVKDELAIVNGYAGPNSVVELEIDGLKYKEAKTSSTGFWSIDIDVAYLNYGEHKARAKQILSDGRVSNFSLVRAFRVAKSSVIQADFDGDGLVNIKDWSVFLFRWENNDKSLRAKIDFNNDGKINVFDLSIFLQAMNTKI